VNHGALARCMRQRIGHHFLRIRVAFTLKVALGERAHLA